MNIREAKFAEAVAQVRKLRADEVSVDTYSLAA